MPSDVQLRQRLKSLDLEQFGDGDDNPVEPGHRDRCTPASIYIEYSDGRSDSARAVTLDSVWRDRSAVRFSGWCHLRKAIRQFRADRVEHLVDLTTGEVPDDPAVWLSEHGLFKGADDAGRLLSEYREELIVATYAARSDGSVSPIEAETVVSLLTEQARPGAFLDRSLLGRRVKRLAPDERQFAEALAVCASQPERDKRAKEWARRVLAADGTVSPEEQALFDQMNRAAVSRVGRAGASSGQGLKLRELSDKEAFLLALGLAALLLIAVVIFASA